MRGTPVQTGLYVRLLVSTSNDTGDRATTYEPDDAFAVLDNETRMASEAGTPVETVDLVSRLVSVTVFGRRVRCS